MLIIIQSMHGKFVLYSMHLCFIKLLRMSCFVTCAVLFVHVVQQLFSRSAYFVRFAASQHRFMIKMRQWNHTLRRDSPFQFRKMPDVGADTNFVEEVLIVVIFQNY